MSLCVYVGGFGRGLGSWRKRKVGESIMPKRVTSSSPCKWHPLGIETRARLFKKEPMSLAEKKCREVAAKNAETELNKLSASSLDLETEEGFDKGERNKYLNRRSARISRLLKKDYINLLELEMTKLAEKKASLLREIDQLVTVDKTRQHSNDETGADEQGTLLPSSPW